MKTKFYFSFILILLVLLDISCKKDKDDPDYVTDYVPTLTESAGKSYSGDYFPFAAGYNWNWSGNATITGSMEISAMGEKETEPLNESGSVSAYLTINSPITLSLNSGNYNVFPTSEGNNTTRYFLKTDTAILIKAIKYNNTLTEVVNPVYIRKPLVVGHSWASTPAVDFRELVESEGFSVTDANLDIKCAIFVLGKENFYWDGQNRETVKLQERARAIGTFNIDYDGITGPMNFDIKMDSKLLLLQNIGIVRQYGTMEMTMSGTLSYMGVSIKMNMNLKQDMDIALDNYNVGQAAVVVNSNELKSTINKKQRTYSANPAINKLAQSIVNSVIKLK